MIEDADDPNRPEVEEDGYRAEALRSLRTRRLAESARRRKVEADDPAPPNDLDHATEYLAWAMRWGMLAQLLASRPRLSAKTGASSLTASRSVKTSE